MAQGTIKSYDPITKTGVVLDDSGTDVPLAEDALEDSIFVVVRQGQRVVYDPVEVAGAPQATRLRLGHDGH